MNIDLDKIHTKLTDEERGVIYSLISRDPLTNLYNRAVVTYILMLFVALLWPFDFAFQREKKLAIYSRPLAEKEIHRNYLAGWLSESRSREQMCRASEGLVSRTQKKSYLDFSYRLFSKNSNLFGDIILNIIIFIPIGFLLHAALRCRYESSLKTSAFVFIIGTLFTFGIESLQYFSLTRHSSIVDMLNNMLGTAVGIATDIFYIGYLKSQHKSLQI